MSSWRWFAILLLPAFAACSDSRGPLNPIPHGASAPPGSTHASLATGSYPTYGSEADVPAAYSLAGISRISPIVYWEGATANASSAMDYFGNYGMQTLNLNVTKDGSSVGSTSGWSNDEHFLPNDYHMVTSGVTLQVGGTCGHVANLTSQHEAKLIFIFQIRGITDFSRVGRPGSSNAAQPGCGTHPCTTVSSNDQSAYGGDYDPTEPATSTCDGGSSGSGTQYGVGDMTGGETVDWTTGIGNGGSSVCGQAAQVDYVCVEYYVEGEGWKDLGCGYVTTC